MDAREGADTEPAFLEFQPWPPGSQAGQPWYENGPFRGQKSMPMSTRCPKSTEEGLGAMCWAGLPPGLPLLSDGALPAAPGCTFLLSLNFKGIE